MSIFKIKTTFKPAGDPSGRDYRSIRTKLDTRQSSLRGEMW